ncbi:unnamed protein product [Mytilus edulis]|uniref:C-type lectin domain-containing protein n=1 Tax=Mytilus edulis TaxID=6550 RepID=A0A8S3TGE6_MYTED|nr:unnamed protein product [Mytilus edulis]
MSSLRKSSVEDEYWDTSRASAKKNKAFNLFDDTVSVETADELRKSKRLLRSFEEDDDESTDTINWDGTPSAETASRTPQPTTVSPSPMHQPIKSSLSHDKTRERLHPIQQMTHTRSQSFTIGAGNVSFQPDSGSMLYSKSHEKLSTSTSNTSLNNQSIHDVVTSYQPKTPQTNDPKKLVEQIQFLQRALDQTLVDASLISFTIDISISAINSGAAINATDSTITTICSEPNEDLVRVDSEERQSYIETITADIGLVYKIAICIQGTSMLNSSHQWTFNDGTRMPYSKWAKGQPGANGTFILFENCYGVYKFKQLYTRRDAVNNILCENGIEFVVNKTSSVVCSKVCASHPFCVSFTYTINGDCHLFNKFLLDTTLCETSPGSSYYAEKDGLLESTTDFMTLFEESTANVVICDAGWVKLGNTCYKFTPDGPKHWTTAKTFCNSIDGYLAIIETSEEDELLKSYVAIIVPSKDYWIGGSDLATEGVFIWENTSATVNLPTSTLFQGWLLDQPDNNGGNQHCMMLAHQFDFKWNDAKCDYPRDYVCEQN